MNYSKYLITFDIETTSFINNDVVFTMVYLASFFRCRFDTNITKEQIEKSNDIKFKRSWSDINNYLEYLNNNAKRLNMVQIIYVHNLAYEFDGLIKNCNFVQQNYDNDKVLFIKPRKPAYIRLENIELRCSYILLNKSLQTLGNILDYHKLDIDYKKQYFPFSELPKEEYLYNERDVKLTMYAILRECKKYNFIVNTSDIPLTYTSFTRQNNLHINDTKSIREFKNRNSVQKNYTIDYIKYLEQIYSGGYTHANAFYTFIPLRDIISVDITSSYPDSMVNRFYPFNFHACVEDVDELMWFRYMIKCNNNLEHVTNNYLQPFKYGFFVTVTLKNVKLKQFNHTEIPYISISKILNDTYRAVADNGRLVRADVVKIALTHIDYFLIEQFYSFELVAVEDLFYTSQFRPLSDFTLNCVRYYADNKSVLKNALKNDKITKNDFYCERTQSYIIDDDIIQNILSLSHENQIDELNTMLMSAKAHLNAQYGINVQRLYQDAYIYLQEADEYIRVLDTTLKRDLLRNFEEGLFIPAYSRLNLFTYALYILQNSNSDLIYSDTDSWKIKGDKDVVLKLTNDYNRLHNEMTNSNDFYNIGQFDVECIYNYFITGGCKKYISVLGDDIIVTIAGVPKKATSKAFTELYNNFCYNDFDFFCNTFFHPNVLLKASLTGKLSSRYSIGQYDGVVTDVNGESQHISFNNMVELFDTDYFLLNTNTPSNFTYLKYLENKQKRKINIKPVVIFKDNDKIQYKYLSDLPTEIETITEVNVDNYTEEIIKNGN